MLKTVLASCMCLLTFGKELESTLALALAKLVFLRSLWAMRCWWSMELRSWLLRKSLKMLALGEAAAWGEASEEVVWKAAGVRRRGRVRGEELPEEALEEEVAEEAEEREEREERVEACELAEECLELWPVASIESESN